MKCQETSLELWNQSIERPCPLCLSQNVRQEGHKEVAAQVAVALSCRHLIGVGADGRHILHRGHAGRQRNENVPLPSEGNGARLDGMPNTGNTV